MQMTSARGHVLLIAGDRAMRRRTAQVTPSANLSALSVLPVPLLLGSPVPADLVHLDGVRDQNTLLVRLRTAAATPGPLMVYLTGRLTVDRKGKDLYLASVGTTAVTARYSALPWTWLQTELRDRPAGATTVVVDLVADRGAWARLGGTHGLPAVNGDTYGVVSPPDFPGGDGVTTYTRCLIEALRNTSDRPSPRQLHALTLAAARVPPGTLVLPSTPEIEHHASPRPASGAGATSTAASAPVPEPTATVPLPTPSPTAASPEAGVRRFLPGQQKRKGQGQGQDPVRTPHPDAATGKRPETATGKHPGTAPLAPSVERPVAGAEMVTQRQPHPPTAPQGAPEKPLPADAAQQGPGPQQDPRPVIWAVAQAGRHAEAAEMAAAWEQYALQQYGHDSPQATQWTEIRAELARIANRWTFATQLWIAATRTRLAHQPPDSTEVLYGAGAAHYCWTEIEDPEDARACGPELVDLLRNLPTLDPRHLDVAQRRLDELRATAENPMP
ncbi:hypothetical protein [Streptomyces tsukubensis]|uniref:Uncharacterized protein n=1 Tax=Streptomyces tsukubensis TaxID=83656 RepID=A0A1V4AA63_9ACTN|nr:hypothetical protein [Streptomyces tsukubensis]OON80052.1 hypothetical protein B1H18_12805 [Streptomyces tsukubensis]QFR97286.1 hypothetical protein GBW32_34770 [Streptomyces tsukubensis]